MTTNLILAGIVMVLFAGIATATLDSDSGGATPEATPSPTATPTPTPEPEPTVAPTPPNRASCPQIRGTDYLSVEERQWFLTNCVSR